MTPSHGRMFLLSLSHKTVTYSRTRKLIEFFFQYKYFIITDYSDGGADYSFIYLFAASALAPSSRYYFLIFFFFFFE